MSKQSQLVLERAAAVALFVGLVGVFLGASFGTSYAVFSNELRRAEQAAELLHRFETIVARQEAFADQLSTTESGTGLEEIFLQARSRSIAAAQLQEQIGSLATRSGVTMNRLSLAGGGSANRVAVTVQVTGDLVAVSTLLVELHDHQPWLFVEEMRLTHPATRRNQTRNPNNPDLVALFTVSAYTSPDDLP